MIYVMSSQQKLLPKVKWGEEEAQNTWHAKYLGSMFEAGGAHMPDVRIRIARARQRFGKMRQIWGNKAPVSYTHLTLPTICSV